MGSVVHWEGKRIDRFSASCRRKSRRSEKLAEVRMPWRTLHTGQSSSSVFKPPQSSTSSNACSLKRDGHSSVFLFFFSTGEFTKAKFHYSRIDLTLCSPFAISFAFTFELPRSLHGTSRPPKFSWQTRAEINKWQ